MISKKDLKDYEFESIEDYFEYIVDSDTNGQFSQVKTLINNLSTQQYKKFLLWLIQYYNNTIKDRFITYRKRI